MADPNTFQDPSNVKNLYRTINKSAINHANDPEMIEKKIMGSDKIRSVKISDPMKEFESAMGKLNGDEAIEPEPIKFDDETVSADNTDPLNDEPLIQDEAETLEEMPPDTTSIDPNMFSEPGNNTNYESYETLFDKPTRIVPPTSKPTLNSALSNYMGSNLDKESEHEEKENLILDIEDLRDELQSDGIDLSRIEEVTQATPIAVIRKVHKVLRNKRDKKRYMSFGNEIIIGGAQLLEFVFDGQTKFGPFQPDLVGWHNSVRPKLRRMRSETASVVGDVVTKYNIGPIARILLELVPSLFIYANMRKNQRAAAPTSQKNQMSEALDDLEKYDK